MALVQGQLQDAFGKRSKVREMVVVFRQGDGKDQGSGDVYSFRIPDFPFPSSNDRHDTSVLQYEPALNLLSKLLRMN